MKLNVQLFARARDLAGGRESVEVEVAEGARVADLRRALAQAVPDLTPLMPRLLIAVNTQYAHEDLPLTPQTDIACFPPVSGG